MPTSQLSTVTNRLVPLIKDARVQRTASTLLIGVPVSVDGGDNDDIEMGEIKDTLSSIESSLSRVEENTTKLLQGRYNYGLLQFHEAQRAKTPQQMVERLETAKDAFIYAVTQEDGDRQMEAAFCVGICHTLLNNPEDALYWYGTAYDMGVTRVEEFIAEWRPLIQEAIVQLNKFEDDLEKHSWWGIVTVTVRSGVFFTLNLDRLLKAFALDAEENPIDESSFLQEMMRTLNELIEVYDGFTDPQIRAIRERHDVLEAELIKWDRDFNDSSERIDALIEEL